MEITNYKLLYLPLFYDDLEQRVIYIMETLQNLQAASDLLDAVEAAILTRLPFAESFEPYNSPTEREHPYYRIYVNNYTIFYVVTDDGMGQKIMEVRRFLYNKENWKYLL